MMTEEGNHHLWGYVHEVCLEMLDHGRLAAQAKVREIDGVDEGGERIFLGHLIYSTTL